ncbi:enhancer of mRNA-decapping protein 3-like [Osmerus eperlanus]|uniref:enhancer of mRNA-decapping protein 3-like n=1 Tax=Osmerus eperlanus TaxID=29151 RepID=UPI002E14DC59
MAADWLGSLVSINCGLTLGVYQGEVASVDQASQTISLRQPFHNGVKCPVPEVTFSAMDIKELKVLDMATGSSYNNNNSSSISKTSLGQRVVTDIPPSYSGHSSSQISRGSCVVNSTQASTSAPITILTRKGPQGVSGGRGSAQVTPKKNGVKSGHVGGQMRQRDDECFGDGVDEGLDTDFDFEGNLALFDKAAVFSQIDGSDRHGNQRARPRSTPNEQTQSRYRHDENILEVKPVVYRQISVPVHGGKEYCTDSGLVVPSISYELHKQLVAVAERYGLSLERRLEMTGVCASQMALTLLGGPNRLTPKNVHQRPTVALLCGPHVQGAQGISCGRHLANHDAEVILFLPNLVKMQESITSELALYDKTGGKQVATVKDLPVSPVDLVINCLDCHENPLLRDQPWYQAAASWANQNRAPVLSLDPPVGGQPQVVEAKWTLALGLPLPLAEGHGRVYLCDIGIPKHVFQEVGITYHSPFGCKFVIPLHSA